MSQKLSRKTVVNDEKDKRPTDSPVKDMKKKMAATVEKEKPIDNPEKAAEKRQERNGSAAEKEKNKPEKVVEKKDAEKKEETKGEKNGKPEKEQPKPAQPQAQPKQSPSQPKPTQQQPQAQSKQSPSQPKPTQQQPQAQVQPQPQVVLPATNGKATNNKQNSSKLNGSADVVIVVDGNGTASGDDEGSRDELFPELTYEDSDDNDDDGADAARSATRRSQVKPTRTPETPRPLSARPDTHDETKVSKLKEDGSERKLRSADSPKPETKTSKKQDKDSKADKDKPEEVVIEIEDEVPRKADTNYSKSRVKVSPYRRSGRLHDNTTSSTLANYTGNNTTMEMDITESSFADSPAPDADSPYLTGLRTIRGRRSYKVLGDLAPRHREKRAAGATPESRPTGTVVGRKRKPEPELDTVEIAREALEDHRASPLAPPAATKRPRLLERLSQSFRKVYPVPEQRRVAEIVGINTDLPLTAPVGANPEALKPVEMEPTTATGSASTVPPVVSTPIQAGDKRCVIM